MSLARASSLAFAVALFFGGAVIAINSSVYFGDEIAPFIIEKLPLPLENVWLLALQIHVVAAALCLPACVVLQSTGLLRRAPRLHRWLGRTTAAAVLLMLAPSGLYLALFAKGGLLGTLGFVLSGIIVIVAMVQGIRHARAGRFVAHRRSTLHVLAQLSVAVTSRTLLALLDLAGMEVELAYLVALWVPVLASAAFVEWIMPAPRRWRAHENPSAVPAMSLVRAAFGRGARL